MFDVLKKDGLSDEATLEKRLQLSLEPRFPQRFQLVGKEHSRKRFKLLSSKLLRREPM